MKSLNKPQGKNYVRKVLQDLYYTVLVRRSVDHSRLVKIMLVNDKQLLEEITWCVYLLLCIKVMTLLTE